MSGNEYYAATWRSFYSRVAPSYDTKVRLLALLVGGRRSFYGRCRQLLGQPQRLLDMGCGTGSLTLALSGSLAAGGVAFGIDLCPEMIAAAQKKSGDRVTFQEMDATQTAFADSSFDAVIVVAVLHEMPYEQRVALLGEARRVLRPGGKLLVGEHFVSEQRLYRWIQEAVFRLISSPPERATFRDLVRRGLSTEIRDAGFAIDAIDVLRLRFFHLQLARALPGRPSSI